MCVLRGTINWLAGRGKHSAVEGERGRMKGRMKEHWWRRWSGSVDSGLVASSFRQQHLQRLITSEFSRDDS
jgi:hypothetical protein